MVLIYPGKVTAPNTWNPSLLVTQPCLVLLDKATCIYEVIKQEQPIRAASEQAGTTAVPRAWELPNSIQKSAHPAAGMYTDT